MQLTLTTNYAIGIVVYMSEHRGVCAKSNEMMRALHITPQYITSVMKMLISSDLVGSKQGRFGGYYLRRQAEEISLYDLICSVEGGVRLNRSRREETRICSVMDSVQDEIIRILKDITIVDFLFESDKDVSRVRQEDFLG